MAGPMIVAHRGASADAPENTMAAFNLAWEQGADAVECDVWMTSDRELVCIHDRTTGRTAGTNMPVDSITLSEIKDLDAGSWKGPQWKGEQVPALKELLESIPEEKKVFIEIKSSVETVKELEPVIESSGLSKDQVIVISFSKEVIRASKEVMPEVKALLTSSFKQSKATKKWTPSFPKLLKDALEVSADGVDVRAMPIIDAGFVKMMHTAGLEVHVWTVNDPAEAKRFADLGFASITTDKPGEILVDR